MSTTDPNNPGGHTPGAGPQWPADVAHGAAPDEHAGGGGVNPEAIKAGHEPDVFYVKPILSIPLAVVLTFVIAFGIVTAVFAYVMIVPDNPLTHPGAAKENDAPLNDRLGRIDRKGENANPDVKADNARLEPLKQLEGEGQTITRPPLPQGYNPPELHPEDINPALRPGKVPELQKTAGGKLAIDDAMSQATGGKRDAVLPARKGNEQVRPTPSDQKPSGANAGRREVAPAPKQAPEPKVEPKKDEPKKDEPKKDGMPPQPDPNKK
jgi:hypothetical protein